MRGVTKLLLVLVTLAATAFSQAGGSGGSGGGGGRPGGNTGGGNNNGTTTVPGSNSRTTSKFPEQRIIFVSGNVILSDGSPVPEPVVIERSCGSSTRREANTDSKGYFSFQLGGRSIGVFQDASIGGGGDYAMGRSEVGGNNSDIGFLGGPSGSGGANDGVSRYDLMGCELRAVLAGYRSSVVHLDNIQYLNQNNVGTIVLAKMGTVPGTTVSVTMLQAPKDAKKEYEKGHEAMQKGKAEDARKHLEKSLEIYPKMAPAHYDLGVMEQKQNNSDAAKKHYAAAMEIDGNYVQPIVQMASLSAMEKNWAETDRLTDKAVQLDPLDFPIAFFYNAVANLNLGKVDDAEKSARKALQLDGGHSIPRLPLLMAKILETKKDYAGAAEQLRTYLKISPDAADAAAARENLATLEKSASQKASQ